MTEPSRHRVPGTHRRTHQDTHPGLPEDPDTDVSDTGSGRLLPARPRWADVGLVAAGGAVGTALRELVVQLLPARAGVPVGVLAANLAGAFLLGALLSRIANRGGAIDVVRRVRLGLGTGVLGGFTTYSALTTDTALLAAGSHPAGAAAYGLGTVALGAVASAAGMALGGRRRKRAVST